MSKRYQIQVSQKGHSWTIETTDNFIEADLLLEGYLNLEIYDDVEIVDSLTKTLL